ncbi:caspase family protein [Heliobacterium chlorum]|uniref:Caspase family protein n=1 Tax=Heliobacterium chlorum TaxID=2698 RepID=A0ABR7SY89_HELCL|nr:caspase family protein [Heliobacterium chlorum]MBC9783484.1 caspase family protein [Heliobacterium chlorum]
MRKALVVGINDYPVNPLDGCVNDAVKVSHVLKTHEDGSINFHVKLMTSPPQTITKPVLRELIEELFAHKNEIALFYFSGHGSITTTGGYIATQDAAKYDVGISMDDILHLANDSPAKDKIIILDCCFSGAMGSPVHAGGGNIARLGDGLTVLTASRSTESSIELDGGGLFTSLLVDALRGGAADLLGNITPGGIYSYIDKALGAWDQRPIFKTNVSRFTSLRQISPQIPLETLRKIPVYFPNPQKDMKLDPTFEDTNVDIAVEKNVKTFKDLQKLFSVGIVRPVGEEYMYFAAMNSKSCRLTSMGYQYWRLVTEGKI